MGDFIFETWENQADKHGTSHAASWGDSHAIDLEVREISRFLPEKGSVLDVGCANGYSTRLIGAVLPDVRLYGVDYSPKMIENAQAAEGSNVSAIRFSVGDARNLDFDDEQFDAAYTTRTLINLPTWLDQQMAIRELMRVTKAGGAVLLSEAFWEPLVRLNGLRLLGGLPPLCEHDFNRYLKLSRLEQFLTDIGAKHEFVAFSSVYYLGSRFLRELVTNPEDWPGYTNPVNKDFYELSLKYSGGPFSVQTLCVIRKS